MKAQLIEGLAVLVLLIAIWLVGTYFVARQAKGIHEQRFAIRSGGAVLLGILALTALNFFAIKVPAGFFGVALIFTFVILRRWQLQIRRDEQK
jgi:hypothetical protein